MAARDDEGETPERLRERQLSVNTQQTLSTVQYS